MNTSGSLLRTPLGKPRARFFGIGFDGEPGPHNAITDVPGVVGRLYDADLRRRARSSVGHGPGAHRRHRDPAAPARELATPVFAGMFSANGNGEMTGSHLIEEIGAFNLPITITNTHSCGVTRDGDAALDAHSAARGARQRLGAAGGGRDL